MVPRTVINNFIAEPKRKIRSSGIPQSARIQVLLVKKILLFFLLFFNINCGPQGLGKP
jgi:hypothetical protein